MLKPTKNAKVYNNVSFLVSSVFFPDHINYSPIISVNFFFSWRRYVNSVTQKNTNLKYVATFLYYSALVFPQTIWIIRESYLYPIISFSPTETCWAEYQCKRASNFVTAFFCIIKLRSALRGIKRSHSSHLDASLASGLTERRNVNRTEE